MRSAIDNVLAVFGDDARMVCTGCAERTPPHPTGMCFSCHLGVLRADVPTREARAGFELAAERGPAGARGARAEEIRKLAKRRQRNRRPRAANEAGQS